ncbi:gamma-glutamylcyclotransferase [Poseidonocella sp. HB161398]|uniref:gamma-glutamylcyclotransferase family protein n=1 Tax=Poseidonocella sp. HB161398 TaxID=2320855 RepID=UPI0011089534|nr:gamma-glutamylcyclotransferase family protein [Poseidonocella sp. HB161398]
MRRERDLPVFVYGTLRPAAARLPVARRLMREGRLIGPARCPGRLYRIHWYPGLVAGDGPDEEVHGDLIALPPRSGLLALLDAYERFRPDQPRRGDFRRMARPVAGPAGRVEAWVYSYHGPVREDWRIPSGDFLDLPR